MPDDALTRKFLHSLGFFSNILGFWYKLETWESWSVIDFARYSLALCARPMSHPAFMRNFTLWTQAYSVYVIAFCS